MGLCLMVTDVTWYFALARLYNGYVFASIAFCSQPLDKSACLLTLSFVVGVIVLLLWLCHYPWLLYDYGMYLHPFSPHYANPCVYLPAIY